MLLNLSPATDDESRRFAHERMALYSGTLAVTTLVFGLAGAALALLVPNQGVAGEWKQQLWGLVTFGALVGGWLVARGGQGSRRTLLALDVVITFSSIATATLTTLYSTPAFVRVDADVALAVALVLMLRAVVIPSAVLRTATISLFGALPALAASLYLAHTRPDQPAPPPIVSGVLSTLFLGLVVVLTSMISSVIYRLRSDVRAARHLGPYALMEKLGEGGMGAVFKAQHALLRRPTAVKLIRTDHADQKTISRFEREVQMTARLTHPNTVGIFDYGRTDDGIFYYAMEYLEGLDCDRLVERFGAQAPERVVHILVQICGALAEAHEAGLVHRDVKPGNIILCARGHSHDLAKILDFGLVKELSGHTDVKLSRAEAFMGTPHFSAPEALVSPETIDNRTDLYALGATAYYLLTGSNVFDGDSVVEVCVQHISTEPLRPSARSNRSIPKALEDIILACLAKEPEQRPASAEALRRELLALELPEWTRERACSWWTEHGNVMLHSRRDAA